MICSGCAQEVEHVITGVVKGSFGTYCNDCIQNGKRMTAAGFAQWSRARDREDNARDLLQPWNIRGEPSRDFITNYPEEAKTIFSEKELEDLNTRVKSAEKLVVELETWIEKVRWNGPAYPPRPRKKGG